MGPIPENIYQQHLTHDEAYDRCLRYDGGCSYRGHEAAQTSIVRKEHQVSEIRQVCKWCGTTYTVTTIMQEIEGSRPNEAVIEPERGTE